MWISWITHNYYAGLQTVFFKIKQTMHTHKHARKNKKKQTQVQMKSIIRITIYFKKNALSFVLKREMLPAFLISESSWLNNKGPWKRIENFLTFVLQEKVWNEFEFLVLYEWTSLLKENISLNKSGRTLFLYKNINFNIWNLYMSSNFKILNCLNKGSVWASNELLEIILRTFFCSRKILFKLVVYVDPHTEIQ